MTIRKYIQNIISESINETKEKQLEILKKMLKTSYINLLKGRNREFNEAKFAYANKTLQRLHNINIDDIISQARLEFKKEQLQFEKEQKQKKIKDALNTLESGRTKNFETHILIAILQRQIRLLCMQQEADEQYIELKEDKAFEVSKITAALTLLKNQNVDQDKVIKNIMHTLNNEMPQDRHKYQQEKYINNNLLPQVSNFSFYTRINKDMIALYPQLGKMAEDFLKNILIFEMWYFVAKNSSGLSGSWTEDPVKYIVDVIIKGTDRWMYWKYKHLADLLDTNKHHALAQQYGLSIPDLALLDEMDLMHEYYRKAS